MTFEEFENIALEAFDSLPDEIKKNLNMGIAVVPEAKRGKEGLTYTLGEYFFNHMMGRGVTIYYGSFMVVMGDAPEAMIRHEIQKTVKHELRHHIEISAGVDILGIEDKEKMTEIKKRFGLLPSESALYKNFMIRLVSTLIILAVSLLLIYILVLRYV
jgi:predicted Zn-dependent protease with MMP-like domain